MLAFNVIILILVSSLKHFFLELWLLCHYYEFLSQDFGFLSNNFDFSSLKCLIIMTFDVIIVTLTLSHFLTSNTNVKWLF